MKQLPPNRPSQTRSLPGAKARAKKVENHPETQALMRKLDELYERLRRRARADWLRRHVGEDPSAAFFSVRIACDNGDSIIASGKVR